MNLKIDLQKADWSTAYVNDLPDSAFLYIQDGGEKDNEGKTKPRTLRHFPYKDSGGKVDLIHVRNAIARIPQSTFGLSSEQMKTLQNRARKYLKKDKVMDKSLTIDLEKAKYKKRIPKAGGGYRYIYDEEASEGHSSDMAQHRAKVSEERYDSAVFGKLVHRDDGNEIEDKINSHPKVKEARDKWKALKGKGASGPRISIDKDTAQYFQVKADYFDIKRAIGELILSQWDKAKKSIGDNDMDKAFGELNDFLKSTIEDEGQPAIGTGKEQGVAMGLDGKGENKSTPGTGSGTPEVGGPPKSKVDKLSEDDEVDEDNMKPHKKPIEKALPLNTWNQVEYMQREHRMYRDACENSDGDIDFSKAMGGKYKQRIAKPGGGYRYIYDDINKPQKSSKKDMNDLIDLQSKIRDIHPLLTTIINESDPIVKDTYEKLSNNKIGHDEAMNSLYNAFKAHYDRNANDSSDIEKLNIDIKKEKDKRREIFKDSKTTIAEVSDNPIVKDKAATYNKLDQSFREGKPIKVKDLLQASKEYYSAFNSVVKKSLSSDDQVVELLKSDRYMAAGNSFTLGYHNQLVQQRICPTCEGHFMKALTVCPHCGN